jgi:hypothetical protein
MNEDLTMDENDDEDNEGWTISNDPNNPLYETITIW